MAAEFLLASQRIEGTELLDALVTGVFLLDQDLQVAYLNTAAQTLLGLSPNQALGQRITELTRGAETLMPLFDRARFGGEGVVQRELAWPAPGDVDRIFDCAVTQITIGQESRLLLEIEDITQHRRLTRENALLAQLGGSRLMVRQLAHEIKNPLGGLRGAAQLLERVYHLLRSEAPEGVTVDRDYDPSLPALTVDPNHIIQAMLNLGRNALQALSGAGVHAPRLVLRTRSAGNVSVGARRHRLVASIQFEDNGPGVPSDIRDTIFYPLVSGRADGTGLGLGIAQDLVSRHGGLIEFDSAPGRTIFVISLPMDAV
jgi:two-component system nitrogen regulation sensor histidine kinase GlnL